MNVWPVIYPSRIVCLTEETVETLYLLGEETRIAGISGFVQRPAGARNRHPRVSTFTDAKIDEILALKPDLVLLFSDIQADIAAALTREGLEVHVFNQRSISEILTTIQTLGNLIGRPEKAKSLVVNLTRDLEAIQREARAAGKETRRPKVYFEEWPDPMISGIRWVSELVEIAGGDDIFAGKSFGRSAKERFVTSEAVIAAKPDIIFGSWCGKAFKPDQVVARPGWETIPAVQSGDVFEIPSIQILQPGPAALTDGVSLLRARIKAWQASHA